MAARGASDSVNMRELEVPLLLFSIFLSTGGSARQTHALFSAQYHTLCFYLSHRRTAAQRTLADPALVERDEAEEGEPVGVSLSVSCDDRLAEQERRDLFIAINHALTCISPIYLYLHTLLFCSERRKDNSAKHVLVEAWLELFFFPFSALYGVCQKQWTWMRRKVWLTRHPPPQIPSLVLQI